MYGYLGLAVILAIRIPPSPSAWHQLHQLAQNNPAYSMLRFHQEVSQELRDNKITYGDRKQNTFLPLASEYVPGLQWYGAGRVA